MNAAVGVVSAQRGRLQSQALKTQRFSYAEIDGIQVFRTTFIPVMMWQALGPALHRCSGFLNALCVGVAKSPPTELGTDKRPVPF